MSNETPQDPQSQSMVKAPATPLDNLIQQVGYQKVRIEKLLPEWMTVDRFLGQVRYALTQSPQAAKLQACSPATVVQAVLTAADLGLDPSGRLGSAWLVPYGTTCQLIPGYRGLIDLAVRSGFVRSVNAWVVKEKDTFLPVNGKTPRHIPYLPKAGEDMDPGPTYAAWCRYKTRDGGDESVIMSLRDLWAIRDRSAGYKAAIQYGKKDNPWITDPDEQYKKTTVRRTLKMAPLNPTGGMNPVLERYAKAIELDDEVTDAVEVEATEEVAPKKSRTEDLKDKL